MRQMLYYADTKEYEIEAEEYPNIDSAYDAMESDYEEKSEYYESSIVDCGIEDELAYIELDDGRRLFWNIK